MANGLTDQCRLLSVSDAEYAESIAPMGDCYWRKLFTSSDYWAVGFFPSSGGPTIAVFHVDYDKQALTLGTLLFPTALSVAAVVGYVFNKASNALDTDWRIAAPVPARNRVVLRGLRACGFRAVAVETVGDDDVYRFERKLNPAGERLRFDAQFLIDTD